MSYVYDPAKISACELPIARRAKREVKGMRMWDYPDAKTFCRALVSMPVDEAPKFTEEEWYNILDVAEGEQWPVPTQKYTREDWERDHDFNAVPGQEIDAEIYEEMFEVLPPIRLPRNERTEGFTCGFMVSEPVTADPTADRMLYRAYGKRGGKYYYIGLLPTRSN